MAHQDMPPPGGFSTINVERTFAKPIIRQGIFALLVTGLTFNGFRVLREWTTRNRVLRTEQTEAFIATHPFMVAEQERKFLLHLRAVREEERELMKNVPGWKLGTLYGEPVFKCQPKDTIPPINAADFTAHNQSWEFTRRVVLSDLHH